MEVRRRHPVPAAGAAEAGAAIVARDFKAGMALTEAPQLHGTQHTVPAAAAALVVLEMQVRQAGATVPMPRHMAAAAEATAQMVARELA